MRIIEHQMNDHPSLRQKGKRPFFTACILLSCILLICSLPFGPVHAEETDVEKQTIRVGFFGFDGYHQMDEAGNRSGYGYDFLQMIAPYANFEYEYIGYDKSWGEMLQMLSDGEIDMVTSARKTPDREALYEYSNLSIGKSFTVFTTSPDHLQYTTEDYSTLDGIRVGLMQDSVRSLSFDAYAKAHGFTYEPVYYPSQKEILQALSEGKEIDAVVTSDLRTLEQEILIDKFDESEIYAIVKKGNHELMQRIDDAIEQLNADSPGWAYALKTKHYSSSSTEGRLLLTTKEQHYIDQLNADGTSLKILINPDLEPYSYFENGKAKGILVDLLAASAKKAGFSYEILETKDIHEYLEMIQSGVADLVFDATFDYNTAEKNGYYLTSPYYTVTYARLTYKNRDTEDSACAVRTYDGLLEDRFLTQYLESSTIRCKTLMNV